MEEKAPARSQILQIARRQLGYVTRRQLLELGASARWIQSQRSRRALISVHAGVYAVGHAPGHARCRAMAAVLACGAWAALSHDAATALWDVAEWPAMLEVSCPGRRTRPGLITHQSHTLDPHDVTKRHGVPVTSPVRTALDVQPRITDDRLIRLVNDLRAAGHMRATAFSELCERSTRVARLLGDGGLTRSALEDLLRAFVARHGLPAPELNARVRIGGRMREVDALYREARLIVELDSWKHHSDRASFERDRAKDAAALADGYRTIRSTHHRLSQGGEQEAATIRAILAG